MATYPIENEADLKAALDGLGYEKKSEKKAGNTKELAETLKLKQETLAVDIQLADAAQDGVKALQLRRQMAADEVNSLIQSLELKGEEASLTEAETAEYQKQLDIIRKKHGLEGATLDEIKEKHSELNRVVKDGAKTGNKYSSMMDSLGKKMLFFGKGPLVKAALGVRTLGKELQTSEAAQQNFRAAIVDTFNVTNLMGNVLNMVAESTMKLVMQLDAAQSSLAGATGFGGQFTDTMRSAQQQGNYLGVTIEGAGKSIQGLAAGYTDFVNISEASKTNLVATTTQLSRIGVDAGTSAEMVQFLTQNLGQTSDQAMETTKAISMMGTSLGITAAEITKQFKSALPTLAVYGDRAPEVFKGLAAAAKLAGVEMGKLLGLAGKFDTFAGAAETTGKLNAILGTQMSAVDLLRQTEDERLETLISTMQAQGRSFKDMDRFTQKAIAAAAGIDDMAEAQRIFGMDLGKFKDYKSQMDASAVSQAKYEEAISKTVGIQEKFTLIMAEFGVAIVPMLEVVHSTLKGILDFFNKFTPEQKEIFIGVVASIAGLFLVMKTFGAIVAIFKTLAGGFTILSAVAGPAGPIIQATSANMSMGINTIGKAIMKNAPAFLILSLSLMAIGKSISMMGKGIEGVAEGSFSGLLIFLGGLIVIAGVLGAIVSSGYGAVVMIAGFGALAAGLAVIGLALQTFPTGVMQSIATIMESLVNLNFESIEAIGGVFTAMAAGLTELSNTANALDGKKIKISSVLENLALLSVGTAMDSMTGAKIDAGAINVQSNLENILNFDDMKVSISIAGKEFNDAVLKVIQTT